MSLLDDVIVININRDPIQWPPEDYYKHYYNLNKDLIPLLKPRIGSDIVFIYRKKNIRSLCKSIDRFFHNFRKTVSKQDYHYIRARLYLVMVNNYEESLSWKEHFKTSFKVNI